MKNEQTEYIVKHLFVVKGMLRELSQRKSLLHRKLHKYPERHAEVNKEIGHLESETDTLLVTLNFIENWPIDPVKVFSSHGNMDEDVTSGQESKERTKGFEPLTTCMTSMTSRYSAN